MTNRLYLGTRRYSSWSMRGWLAVRLAGLEAEDVVVPLGAHSTPDLLSLTPAGLVPAFEHQGRTIWDSLAICEYCAEFVPALWPADQTARAVARSVAAEMHSGFRALRAAMPMNLGRTDEGAIVPAEVMAEITRIDTVWNQCIEAHGGPYLFGAAPTIADIMYAPVATRFITYGPSISPLAQAYCETIRAWDLVDQWYKLAADEPPAWRLAKYE